MGFNSAFKGLNDILSAHLFLGQPTFLLPARVCSYTSLGMRVSFVLNKPNFSYSIYMKVFTFLFFVWNLLRERDHGCVFILC